MVLEIVRGQGVWKDVLMDGEKAVGVSLIWAERDAVIIRKFDFTFFGDYEKKGYDLEFYRMYEKDCRRDGIKKMLVVDVIQNSKGEKFWKRCGFRPTEKGTMDGYLTLEKILDAKD